MKCEFKYRQIQLGEPEMCFCKTHGRRVSIHTKWEDAARECFAIRKRKWVSFKVAGVVDKK